MATSHRLRDLEERLAGLDSTSVTGLQRVYFVAGVGLILTALVGVVAIDLLRGDPAGALRIGGLAVLLASVVVRPPTPTRALAIYRLMVAVGLVVLAYEALIGSNDGFTFLWFYIFPISLYFLFGRREGLMWNGAIGLFIALLLGVGGVDLLPGGNPGGIAFISFALLCFMGHGLESTRAELLTYLTSQNQALHEALADLRALKGLVPLCARCKRTRDDAGFWSQIESYLGRHSPVELQAALCPDCADASHDTPDSGTTSQGSMVIRLQALRLPFRRAPHHRRRRTYFTWALGSVIPILLYFGGVDILAQELLGASLAFALALVFAVAVVLLRRGRCESLIYHLGLGAALLVVGYDLHAGSFQGFAAVWLYVFPILTLLVLGLRGIVWAVLAYGLATIYLLLPIGHTYSIEFASRFLVTFFLSSLMAFWLERLRLRAQGDLEREHAQLQRTLDDLETLQGMLPMCPQCKSVRDDQGFWQRIETYLSKVSGTRFSHGLCPECGEKTLAEM